MTELAIAPAPAAVICRNMTAGPLVIASNPRREHEVTFEGKGDLNGGDYQHMPPEILATPAFAKQIALGTLVVTQGTDNPAVKAALANQSDAFWKRAEADKSAALATLDHEPDKDFLAIPCIGPGTRQGATCGTEVPVKAAQAAATPPLCSAHTYLTDRCVKRGNNPWAIEG